MSAPTLSTTDPAPNRWIVSPRFDSIWFLLTPLLCAAFVLPLRSAFDSRTIFVFVLGFSSFGHHLPGFLRAYGDSELFARYRLRFLAAPIVVYATFVTFGLLDLQGMLLVLMAWSVWHVGMQHFGFMRIYDAKRGIHDPLGARLDWIVSIAWFVAILLNSSTYGHIFVERLYATGIRPSPATFAFVARAALFLALGSSAAYVVHVARRLVRREPVSWIKLTLLVVTVSFLAFVWAGLGDIYLGLATWEIFHDLQYVALTWVVNRRLVDGNKAQSSVLRAFFSPGRVALYALAIATYGSLSLLVLTTEGSRAFTFLLAFLLSSTFLHYYYDGFLWKVRHARNRAGLSLAAVAAGETKEPGLWRARAIHAGLFLLPIGAVAAAETLSREQDDVTHFAHIAEVTSADPLAHANLARARQATGDFFGAVAAWERGIEADPTSAVVLDGLALFRHAAGRLDEAEALWRRALEADPIYHVALRNYGTFLTEQGRPAEASEIEKRARRARGRLAQALLGLVPPEADAGSEGQQ